MFACYVRCYCHRVGSGSVTTLGWGMQDRPVVGAMTNVRETCAILTALSDSTVPAASSTHQLLTGAHNRVSMLSALKQHAMPYRWLFWWAWLPLVLEVAGQTRPPLGAVEIWKEEWVWAQC